MNMRRFWLLGSALLLATEGCVAAECATPDYTRAECRVLAENQFAQLRTSTGIDVRMQAPTAESADGWAVTGLVRERDDHVQIRVATLGNFMVSIADSGDPGSDGPAPPSRPGKVVRLELANVHPSVELEAQNGSLLAQTKTGTKRSLSVFVHDGETALLRGTLPECDMQTPPIRILALADVQTNPNQFQRIIAHINEHELADAEQAGELLVGVVMAGDLTESSTEHEFRIFADRLESASVPFALTPGNHDVYASHLPFYNQNFGPGNYEFDVCGVHVAMLDTGSGAIAPSVVGRLPELFTSSDDVYYSMAVMHHPPHAALTGDGWGNEDLAMITLGEFALQDGDMVIAGHSHMLRKFEDIGVAGVNLRELIVGTGGAEQGAGPPIYGYVRLSFDGDRILDPTPCFVQVPPPGATAVELPNYAQILECDDPR